jgi:site-specific DNA-methyltransferase (adenine-specific)
MSNKKVEFEIIHMNKLIRCLENPRNNQHAIRKVANSIKLNGFAAPIVANYNYEVLAGHTRLAAVKLLQKEEPKEDYSMVPVRFIDLTGEQARLYRIQDNRLGEFATWKEEELKKQLQDLQIDYEDALFDLNFDLDELDNMLSFDEVDSGGFADATQNNDKTKMIITITVPYNENTSDIKMEILNTASSFGLDYEIHEK